MAPSVVDSAAAPVEEGLKRPPNAYFLWQLKNRSALEAEAGSKKPGPLGKLAGEKWKAMSEAQREPFVTEAAQLKKEYDAKIAAGAQKNPSKRKAKAEAEGGSAPKKARKKRAPSAYWLWLNDNRARITKEVGPGKVTLVSKEAGKQWQTVSDDVKAEYQKKAKELEAEMKAKEAEGEGAGDEGEDEEEQEDDGEQ
eukprot:CAMPEP_0178398328 /NCGR_PEP_ID=MMETSP0689_2-20121128/14716_1 /TAXON_ID=160604 /ORGANISM="Amphidinium massartii, Strain CS-259" /LENGTH=195 /DNA_ID=CAMNT_0020019087 /DNA_START=97 /DNA_END=684 /DNA_ORIENTATION=+